MVAPAVTSMAKMARRKGLCHWIGSHVLKSLKHWSLYWYSHPSSQLYILLISTGKLLREQEWLGCGGSYQRIGGGSFGNLIFTQLHLSKEVGNEQGPMKINTVTLLIRALLMGKMILMFYLLILLDSLNYLKLMNMRSRKVKEHNSL